MTRSWFCWLLCLAVHSLTLGEEGTIVSGPQPGTPLGPVMTYDGQGPYRGQEFDAAAEIGQNPGALLFVNSATRNTYPVLQGLDQLAGRLSLYGFRAFTIHLADDRNAAEYRIRRRNGEPTGGHKFSVTGKYGALHLETPMMLSLDGLDGPGGYGLNRRAVMTLVTTRAGHVLTSHTFTDTGQHDLSLLERLATETLGPLPATPEARRTLPDDRLPKDSHSLRQLAVRYLALWGWQDTTRHPMLSVIEERTGKLPDPDEALREWVTKWIPNDPELLHAMARRQAAELFDLHTRLFAAREGRLPYTAMKTPAIRTRMGTLPYSRSSIEERAEHATANARKRESVPPRTAPTALPADPKLRQLFRSLIRKTNSAQTTDEVFSEIMSYGKGSASLNQQAQAMMTFILSHEDLGSEYARSRIARFSEHFRK